MRGGWTSTRRRNVRGPAQVRNCRVFGMVAEWLLGSSQHPLVRGIQPGQSTVRRQVPTGSDPARVARSRQPLPAAAVVRVHRGTSRASSRAWPAGRVAQRAGWQRSARVLRGSRSGPAASTRPGTAGRSDAAARWVVGMTDIDLSAVHSAIPTQHGMASRSVPAAQLVFSPAPNGSAQIYRSTMAKPPAGTRMVTVSPPSTTARRRPRTS